MVENSWATERVAIAPALAAGRGDSGPAGGQRLLPGSGTAAHRSALASSPEVLTAAAPSQAPATAEPRQVPPVGNEGLTIVLCDDVLWEDLSQPRTPRGPQTDAAELARSPQSEAGLGQPAPATSSTANPGGLPSPDGPNASVSQASGEGDGLLAGTYDPVAVLFGSADTPAGNGAGATAPATPGRSVPARRVVTWATPWGWQYQRSHRTGGTPTATLRYTTGSGTVPQGRGSLRLVVGADGNSFLAVRNTGYHGVRLNQLTALRYSAYVEQFGAGAGARAPYLSLLLDTDNDGRIDDQIVFDPALQPAPAVTRGVWQTWDALAGRWWSAGGAAGATATPAGVKTLAQYLAARPNARIVNGAGEPWGRGTGGLRLAAGWGPAVGTGFRGFVDNLTVGTSGGSTTSFDFESSNEVYSNSEPPFGYLGDGQDTGGDASGVYLHNGEFHTRVVDLAIPGRGFDWRFERSYRSRVDFDGPLGHNWDFVDNRRLRVAIDTETAAELQLSFPNNGPTVAVGDVVRLDGRNRADLYKLNPSTGGFTAPDGFYTALTRNPIDGGSYRERDASGMVYAYDVPDLRGVARIASITDRNGNVQRYLYDNSLELQQVVDTLGRVITYSYHPDGRLWKVTDFFNRTLTFLYSPQGDLEKGTSPAVVGTVTGNDFLSGKTTSYSYRKDTGNLQLDHNLLTVVAPSEFAVNGLNGTPRVVLTYEEGGNHIDRVKTQAHGGLNASGVPAGGTIQYAYTTLADPLPPLGDTTTAVFQTTVTDRKLHQTQYQANRQGNILQTIESPVGSAFLTNYRYSPDYEQTTETLPLGNRVLYTYQREFGKSTGGNGSATLNDDAKSWLDNQWAGRFVEVTLGPGAGQVRKVTGNSATQLTVTEAWSTIPSNQSFYTVRSLYQVVVDSTTSTSGSNTLVDNTPGTWIPGQWVGSYVEITSGTGAGQVRRIIDNSPSQLTVDLPWSTSPLQDSGYAILRPNRYEQGNLVVVARLPDLARGGDQSVIRTATLYEPVYNQVHLQVDPRGLDPAYRPPIRLAGESYPNLGRYATVHTFDYQEGNDLNGLALIVGTSSSELQQLDAALVGLGLNDINGDLLTNQTAGNVLRTDQPKVNLLPGSNEAAIETALQGGQPTTVQPVVEVMRYNSLGQLTRQVDAEGNVDLYGYYPENDPDGDGTPTPVPPDGRTLNTSTGGYLRQSTRDAESGPLRNSGTNPTPASIRRLYRYDPVGNVTEEVDGRGVVTAYEVNQLNQVVEFRRAAELDSVFNPLDPAEPLPLATFTYMERTFYDYNNNVVLHQAEDRGNTSSVDGNPPAGDLPAGVPGASNPDPAGGLAYVDTVYKHDILDQLIETVQEVKNGSPVGCPECYQHTKYRYDADQNPVFTILPEGNASASLYDERDLQFQTISGASTRPAEGLYATSDPLTFIRPGGLNTEPSIRTNVYDSNRNVVRTIAAADTDGDPTNNAPIPGTSPQQYGDVTDFTFDGYDRRRTVTDALGNGSTTFYDPSSDVIRVIQDGAPNNDVVGTPANATLAVTESVHDELSRVFVTHQVLFRTPYPIVPPGQEPQRAPTLTDQPAMDALAAYLSVSLNQPGSDTDAVPGAIGIAVIGRVSTLTEYDRAGRVAFTVQDDLDTYRSFYDGAGRVIKTSDSALSNGFSAGAFNPANLSGNTGETAYDDNNNPIERKETDVTTVAGVAPEEFRTTWFYDSLNRLEIVMDSRGHADDYRYDSRGNLAARADAVGPVPMMGARMLPRRGLGSTANVTVNDFGNVTRRYYDGLSRLVESETLLAMGGQGNGSYIGADIDDVKLVLPSGNPPAGYLETGNAADGRISTYYAYDANSQLLALRDDNGNTTAYVYDNQNRVLVERKGLNDGYQNTTFSIAGGDGGAFSVALRGGFPPQGADDTEAAGSDITSTFDRDSNVATVMNEGDVNGLRSTFTSSYDALNRRKTLAVSNPPSSQFLGTTQQTWKYDGLSRQTESFDNNNGGDTDDVTVKSFYDSLSRLVEEQQRLGPSTGSFLAVSSSYDIANRRGPLACHLADLPGRAAGEQHV